MADTRVKTFDDFAEHARILDVNGNIIICLKTDLILFLRQMMPVK
jgi:hypothetical protein